MHVSYLSRSSSFRIRISPHHGPFMAPNPHIDLQKLTHHPVATLAVNATSRSFSTNTYRSIIVRLKPKVRWSFAHSNRSFTQNFLSRDSVYGLGHTSRPIRALSSVKSATTDGRDRVIFVNSGFVNGTIDKVIADVAAPLRESGINIVTLERQEELSTACTSNVQGTSHCIAGVVFYSSPTEGNGSIWNYTIRADGALSKEVFVDADNNDAQVYVMPIQHEIDWSIARHTSSANQSSLPLTISEYPFTSKSEDQRQRDNRVRFMNMITNILAAPIYLALACVVYHMTGFIATEREIGMARLLETMMPNRSRRQPQVARVVSYHLAFDFLYGPGKKAPSTSSGLRHMLIVMSPKAGSPRARFSALGAFLVRQLSFQWSFMW